MDSARLEWVNTTHDWSAVVDHDHLHQIRAHPEEYAPGGPVHLLLEVIAYADDEAESLGRQGVCTITLYGDGSVSIADDGRGTDTRPDGDGAPVRKPVMTTKDLRFFDGVPAAYLPDGRTRRGLSVVAALSEWLVHTNRRHDGAWSRRYEMGSPRSISLPSKEMEQRVRPCASCRARRYAVRSGSRPPRSARSWRGSRMCG